MTQTHGGVLLRHIRKLVAAQCPSRQSDLQLLERFLADRDEAAFAALVQRHGGIVLGVCRGVLHHQQDAEDVFQATFLVLARKAGTIRDQQALSSWLHGVAYRLALKARRRQRREQPLTAACAANPTDDLSVRELRGIVHEELQRLPEKYRTPLLLCYWEGKTRDESAERLGISPDAFKKRLERARNLLGSRLTRRGLVPSAAFFAALLSADGVHAAISHSLITSTAQVAVAFAAGQGASVGVSAAAAALAEGVIRTMNVTKWTTVIAVLLLIGGTGTGLGFLTYQSLPSRLENRQADNAAEANHVQAKAKEVAPHKPDKDRILGVWRIAKVEGDAKDWPAVLNAVIRFKFTKEGKVILSFAVNDVVAETEGKYKLASGGKIDLTVKPQAMFSPGIYRFDGDDRLTFCANIYRGEQARPFEFKSELKSEIAVFFLARCKPGEERPTAEDIAKTKVPATRLREIAARTICIDNMTQIALAFHGYHDQNKSLPAHAIYGKDGKTPLLSWRVAILPFMEQEEALYNEFKLDEPWDSPTNKKLIGKMPKCYEAGGLGVKGEGLTYWQVVTGPDTVFDGAKKMAFVDITDGTSNTILMIEAKDPVIWTKPADLVLPKDKDKKLPVGGLFKNGFLFGVCDGGVRMMPRDPAPALLRGLITPRGGEKLD